MLTFFHQRDSTCLRLAAARHYPSTHNDRLIEDGAETIAGHVVIAGDPVVDTYSDDCPCGQRQRLREHSLVWLPLGLRVRLLLCRRVRLSLSLRILGCHRTLDFAGLIRLILLCGGVYGPGAKH